MLSLNDFLILEGGAAGHMSHLYDLNDLTCHDLVELVQSLFANKIEGLKEKLDGFNIFASINDNNEVVFVRNKANLNSEKGGMTIDEIKEKWEGHQQKVFLTAANIITEVFKKIGSEYFNIDSEHRKYINCECIISGKTNVLLYASDYVVFHGYKIYKRENNKWIEVDDVEGDVKELYDIAKDLDTVYERPQLIIKDAIEANKLSIKYTNEIKKIFSDDNETILNWKHRRFNEFSDFDNSVFNRLFDVGDQVNLREIKKKYPDYNDKDGRKLVQFIMAPLDDLISNIGNDLISLLDGFVNDSSMIDSIKKDLDNVIDDINKNGSEENKEKLQRNLLRLQKLGNKINQTEGIVLVYKGNRIKLTGSFAALNQIIGMSHVQ